MYHMIMVLFKKSRLLRRFFSRGYAKHRNGYLLGDRLCKCVTHSDANFWPRTWSVWVWVSCRRGHFGSCGSLLWKYLKLWELCILLLWCCIGHNSAAGEVKQLLQVKFKKWHRVYSGLLDVARSSFSWRKILMVFLSLSLLVESKVSVR